MAHLWFRLWQGVELGAVSISRCRLTSIGTPKLKIRRSRDRLIFNLGIPILILRWGPGDNSLSGPIMAQFSDVYMHHQASTCELLINISVVPVFVLSYAINFSAETHAFVICTFPPHGYGTDSWNLFYVADKDLSIFHSQYDGYWQPGDARAQGASASMIFAKLNWDNSVLAH